MNVAVILVGIVCASIFALVGPAGVILVGLLLVCAGVSNKKD